MKLSGASMQIAFKTPSEYKDTTTMRVCLLSVPEGHSVYSQTWDGFGADAMRRKMLAPLSSALSNANNTDSNSTRLLQNPCLPLNQHRRIPPPRTLPPLYHPLTRNTHPSKLICGCLACYRLIYLLRRFNEKVFFSQSLV